MPTVNELKQRCRERNIRGFSKLRKTELLTHCQWIQQPSADIIDHIANTLVIQPEVIDWIRGGIIRTYLESCPANDAADDDIDCKSAQDDAFSTWTDTGPRNHILDVLAKDLDHS